MEHIRFTLAASQDSNLSSRFRLDLSQTNQSTETNQGLHRPSHFASVSILHADAVSFSICKSALRVECGRCASAGDTMWSLLV